MSKTSNEYDKDICQKLDEDLNLCIAEAKKDAHVNPYSTDNGEVKNFEAELEEMMKHPAFMKEIDLSKPLTPDVEGLMALKYESENPTANADSYRDEGNYEFKKKKYKLARDNYTAAIKCRCPQKELNAVCYSNRAAAQFHLGNYRSALNDCIFARKFKPDHFKAIFKGAQCCLEMGKSQSAINWCEAALLLEPENPKLLEMRKKAERLKKNQDRDRRKQEVQERKEMEEEQKLISVIERRGVHLAGMKQNSKLKKGSSLLLTSVETCNPSGAKVFQDENGILHWPVMFFYPEYGETDFIEKFCENDSFFDHLVCMFGPEGQPVHWDADSKYTPEHIQIFFENRQEEKLYPVPSKTPLLKILQHEKYVVTGGTPSFILLSVPSKFATEFLKRYE